MHVQIGHKTDPAIHGVATDLRTTKVPLFVTYVALL
jgi:hypothetical protein